MSDPSPQPKTLTTKQQRFVDAYCGGARFNKAKAARMAGYAEKSAKYQGRNLFAMPHVRAEIEAILADISLSAPEVLAELTDVAMRRLDEEVEVRRYGEELSARMDASAKMKALELLGKHHKLFTDKVDHGGAIAMVPIREIQVPKPEDAD